MSMLAERRQKQKWTLNPRGKWWTEDSNKFGQKMLEKMGWTKGKGLGINEQGITEFSSMSYKSDTTGMGYNKNFETWTEHQDKFGNFLQQLNGNEDAVRNGDTTLSGQSIEFKSKQSQARVHYKKFTRGKDINKYKSKDLANIFGQKELAEKIPIKIEKSDNICKTEASGFRDDWYGVFTINGGNMTDYFKLKSKYNNMSDYLKCSAKLNNDTISSNMTDNRTTESEDNQYVGFGFTQKPENTSLSSCEAETVYDANGFSTKSSKKKKKEFEINNLYINEIDKHDTRKKLDSDDKSNYAFDNPCLGLNSPTETTCDTNGSFTKKKKKEFEVDNLHIAEIDKHDTRKKLKNSDDKNNYAFDNPCLGLNSPTESACDTNDSSIKSRKKRKKEFENDSLRITETDKHDTKKQLKDSDDKSNYAFDNPCLGLNSPTETACDTNGSSIKSIKKRKKEFESDSLHITETDKHNTRKKLKTETIDSDCKNGFINPALNLDAKPEEDYNGKEFEVFRTQLGLENCGLDLTDEKNDKKRVTFNDHVMLYEYNINSDKKKKEEITLDKFEVENKKSKKKRKHESTLIPITNGFVNEALDVQILYEEIKDNKLNECRNKKIKKRKICKTFNLETIQESPEKEIIETNNIESEDTLDIIENEKTDNVNTDTEQKSKKKKKKKKEKEEEKTEVEDITVLHVINKELDIEIKKTTRSKKVKKDKESKEEEETTISKKCKKNKKKDKENYKSEKHSIQAEINNEQQDTKILHKLDSKQQNDYLTESENKNAAIIETSSVPTVKEEEEEKEESLEKIKHKKKKRKSISKEDYSSQIDMCTVERGISDKENTDTHKEQDSIAIKKSTKKEKKGKKSKDKNISDIGDTSDFVDASVIEENKIENAEFTDTLSKKGKMTDAIDDIINSSWSIKARMSKRMLITLFHNNAISEFPGSNIKNIKGYGIDDECELE